MPHAQSPVSLPPGDIPISRNADTGRTTINARPGDIAGPRDQPDAGVRVRK